MFNRIVFHLDMDAFFAAVEERDHPEFAGMPIVVGADPHEGTGRGVVSTASYAAREYGVGSAMPISKAWHLCQEGERLGGERCIFFGGVFGKYGEESLRVMDVVRAQVQEMEQVGLDETYFISNVDTYPEAIDLAKSIKRSIHKQTGLTASIGIGPNKLIAKIASDMEKPDGLTAIEPDRVESFLAPLSVRRIPGIGPKAATLLSERGVTTIADGRRISERELTQWFGKWGGSMYRRFLGEDERIVAPSGERKSLGHERTFMDDVTDPGVLIETTRLLAEQVGEEVRERGVLARRITLRVRFGDFETLTRQVTLSRPSDEPGVIERESLKLLMPFLDKRENPYGKSIRLLGVRAGQLTVEQPLQI